MSSSHGFSRLLRGAEGATSAAKTILLSRSYGTPEGMPFQSLTEGSQ